MGGPSGLRPSSYSPSSARRDTPHVVWQSAARRARSVVGPDVQGSQTGRNVRAHARTLGWRVTDLPNRERKVVLLLDDDEDKSDPTVPTIPHL